MTPTTTDALYACAGRDRSPLPSERRGTIQEAPAGLANVVRGTGSALPQRVIANAEIEARLDAPADWIRPRTGRGAA